jgi:hypothetical protein
LKKDNGEDGEVKHNGELCFNDSAHESSVKPLKNIKKEQEIAEFNGKY